MEEKEKGLANDSLVRPFFAIAWLCYWKNEKFTLP